MTKSSKIDRSRRNLLKAASLVGGALVATAAPRGAAQAQGWPGGGGWGNRGGRDNHGGGHNGDNHSCFQRGTLIDTADGYRPIETLMAGELLPTRFSGMVAIKAVTSFSMARPGAGGNWPAKSRPVVVKRGALGDDLPSADLCLTESHAIFKDGFLVVVGDLVNGVSISFEPVEGLGILEFFHVELDEHDVIYANGAPCESLREETVEACVPVLGFNGGRGHLTSRLRSAASVIVDFRRPIDIIRDELEERVLRARTG